MEAGLSLVAGFVGRNWEILDLLLVAIGLVIYVAASHALNQRRHPSAAIAWVMGILLVPYVALPLYLLFGTRKVVRSLHGRARRPVLAAPARHTTMDRSLQLAAAMGLPDPVGYEKLVVHEDGSQAREALLAIIGGAQRSLDVSSFLLGRDALGLEVAALLRQRAQAGVRVRLLIDGIGIYIGGYPDIGSLRRAGVEVLRFVPPFSSPTRGRTNLRNHRKMVIADESVFWCGGRNLAAEYFEGVPRPFQRGAPWIDLSFDLQGPVVRQAVRQFEKDWVFAKGGEELPAGGELPVMAGIEAGSNAAKLVQLVDSGPDRADDTIFTLLVSACFTSQRRILAVTPYFVPEASLLTALMLAARRGITVDLVLPARSNHRLADYARHRALRDLVAAGGRVWLHPRMIHAKAVLIDDELALAGSANLDGRSLFLNYELMLAFYDRAAVTAFARWVEARREECAPYIRREPGVMREVAEGLILWLAFQL